MRAAVLPRALARAVAWPPSAGWSLLSARARRLLVATACLAALVAGTYLLWFRDSSLVRVEEVTVSGVTSADAGEIRATLRGAAREMTTLHLDTDALERAVAGHPAVAGLEVDAGFPDRLAIEVVERRPVAAVTGPDGQPVPVAADGTLLQDFEANDSLVSLPASVAAGDRRLGGSEALAALAAASAAPAELREHVAQVAHDEYGELVATLDDGPAVLLGDGVRLEDKWAAAAAVIAAGQAAGAGYVDVSLPERPAVGG